MSKKTVEMELADLTKALLKAEEVLEWYATDEWKDRLPSPE